MRLLIIFIILISSSYAGEDPIIKNLIISKESKKYDKGLLEEAPTIRSMKKTMGSCTEVSPMAYYAHFTGKSKPWLCDKKKPPRSSGARAVWLAHLDALKLPINSKNISKLVLSSPLGYFNARFPKGGYKQS